jgi:ribosomal protein S18 acetylase RimI-like enzyme
MTSDFTIRNVRPDDLAAVTALEAAAFPPAEAATEAAFRYRIAAFPERFFVAEADGKLIGLVNGCASNLEELDDALYEPQGHEPNGKNQMVFGLAVDEAFRRRGVGAALLGALTDFAAKVGMRAVLLTCKKEKIAYYERLGFSCRGVSRSAHGGAVWYDMEKIL